MTRPEEKTSTQTGFIAWDGRQIGDTLARSTDDAARIVHGIIVGEEMHTHLRRGGVVSDQVAHGWASGSVREAIDAGLIHETPEAAIEAHVERYDDEDPEPEVIEIRVEAVAGYIEGLRREA